MSRAPGSAMKERELREAATCAACGELIGKCGVPPFWRVTLEHWGILLNAVQRQTGLEMMMGGSVALAQVFSPDEDMARRVAEPTTFTVCSACAEPLHVILERVQARRPEEGTDR